MREKVKPILGEHSGAFIRYTSTTTVVVVVGRGGDRERKCLVAKGLRWCTKETLSCNVFHIKRKVYIKMAYVNAEAMWVFPINANNQSNWSLFVREQADGDKENREALLKQAYQIKATPGCVVVRTEDELLAMVDSLCRYLEVRRLGRKNVQLTERRDELWLVMEMVERGYKGRFWHKPRTDADVAKLYEEFGDVLDTEPNKAQPANAENGAAGEQDDVRLLKVQYLKLEDDKRRLVLELVERLLN